MALVEKKKIAKVQKPALIVPIVLAQYFRDKRNKIPNRIF